MKVLIIEDATLTAQIEENYLKKHFDFLEIYGPFYKNLEVKNAIKTIKPQLVIMDIELSQGNSFDILDELQKEDFKIDFEILFVTGWTNIDYRLRALQFSEMPFVSKPIDESLFIENVQTAIHKIKSGTTIENQGSIQERLKVLLQEFQDVLKLPGRISIHQAAGNYYTVNVMDIMYFQADGTMCDVFLTDGKTIKGFRNLGKYRDLLEDGKNFISISKSICLNMNYLKNFSYSDRKLKLTDGTELYASRRKAQELRDTLENQLLL